jgi:hypothetical protein
MTKQIKLRAWNIQEKIMLYRNLFDMNWYTTQKNDENGSHCWGSISGGQSRFLEVMLMTPFIDKKGKHVYEGDIVKVYDSERHCDCEDIDHDEPCEDQYVCTQTVKLNEEGGYVCEEDTGDFCPLLGADEIVLEIVADIYNAVLTPSL